MKLIPNGVCAPIGFKAAGIHCGIRKNKAKKDLALIVSDTRAAAAAVYTTNLVHGAPITITRENIANGYAQAMICNSGNANVCNANGIEIARTMCAFVEQHSNIPATDVIIASTGVIGQPLPVEPIADGMSTLVGELSRDGWNDAANAIMTTDLREKIRAVEFELGGKTCRIGAIAKGSGMINPNMATMLAFITTDVAITPEMLQLAINRDVRNSFNMISVDGDTSTSDMMSIMANGMAGNATIDSEGADFDTFCIALAKVTTYLAMEIARDGEGAKKLIYCNVGGDIDDADARIAAKSVINSSLVKTMIFGADANVGRIMCAIGYSGADVDVSKIDIALIAGGAGAIKVCENGIALQFDEDKAKNILEQTDITICIDIKDKDGNQSQKSNVVAWGCELTYDYVKLNGDYRS